MIYIYVRADNNDIVVIAVELAEVSIRTVEKIHSPLLRPEQIFAVIFLVGGDAL